MRDTLKPKAKAIGLGSRVPAGLGKNTKKKKAA